MRTLLTTTALVALMSMGVVHAQEAGTAGTSNLLEQGYQLVDTDGLASKLMGFPVYNSAGDDAEQLGEINDIVIGESGEVSAVILGVGGFLGIGEKNVAVNYEDLEWTVAADDTERLVLETTRESLEAAAAVELIEDEPMDTAATDAQPVADQPMDDDSAEVAAAPADERPIDEQADTTEMAAAPAADQPAEDDAMSDDAMQTAEQSATDEAVDPVETGAVQQPAGDVATDDIPAFDPGVMTEFDESTLTAEDLIGTNVYGPENEHIGTIGDFVLGENGEVDAIIIDFGGFLGIGVKEVAVGYDDLSFYTDEAGNHTLLLNVTREQMEQATAFNRETYQAERDTQRMQVSML